MSNYTTVLTEKPCYIPVLPYICTQQAVRKTTIFQYKSVIPQSIPSGWRLQKHINANETHNTCWLVSMYKQISTVFHFRYPVTRSTNILKPSDCNCKWHCHLNRDWAISYLHHKQMCFSLLRCPQYCCGSWRRWSSLLKSVYELLDFQEKARFLYELRNTWRKCAAAELCIWMELHGAPTSD
jgi:hypothetical protein